MRFIPQLLLWAILIIPGVSAEATHGIEVHSRRRRRRHGPGELPHGGGVGGVGYNDTNSAKRGIALNRFSRKMLQSASGMATWAYTWSSHVKKPTLEEFDEAGVHWAPMIFDAHRCHKHRHSCIQGRGRKVLLGFNEPNFRSQADMSPKEAARGWKKVEEIAKIYNIERLVGPAMNYAHYHPVKWLKDFFKYCEGCRVDAIAVHIYGCKASFYKKTLDMYKKAFPGYKIWITEFACVDFPYRRYYSVSEQKRLMRNVIPMFEKDDVVEAYSWFAARVHWGATTLFHRDGRRNSLGHLYASLSSR